jgi:hypothetical protein
MWRWWSPWWSPETDWLNLDALVWLRVFEYLADDPRSFCRLKGTCNLLDALGTSLMPLIQGELEVNLWWWQIRQTAHQWMLISTGASILVAHESDRCKRSPAHHYRFTKEKKMSFKRQMEAKLRPFAEKLVDIINRGGSVTCTSTSRPLIVALVRMANAAGLEASRRCPPSGKQKQRKKQQQKKRAKKNKQKQWKLTVRR